MMTVGFRSRYVLLVIGLSCAAHAAAGCTNPDDGDGSGGEGEGSGGTSLGAGGAPNPAGGESGGDGDSGGGTDSGGNRNDGSGGLADGSGGAIDDGNPCGNDELDPGESCDDGNRVSEDGCSEKCSVEGVVIPCGEVTQACGDGIDNDGDGFVDLDDPDCSSPCDNSEIGFANGIDPGGTCLQDCYFDATSASGDDLCSTQLRCDPLSPGAGIECAYDAAVTMCGSEPDSDCLTNCLPMAPNGCDCFGCCLDGGTPFYLGSGGDCSATNKEACAQCVVNYDCFNPCEDDDCELCMGQSIEDLPAQCEGVPSCGEDGQSCSSVNDCSEGQYCMNGCCHVVSVQ